MIKFRDLITTPPGNRRPLFKLRSEEWILVTWLIKHVQWAEYQAVKGSRRRRPLDRRIFGSSEGENPANLSRNLPFRRAAHQQLTNDCRPARCNEIWSLYGVRMGQTIATISEFVRVCPNLTVDTSVKQFIGTRQVVRRVSETRSTSRRYCQ